MKGTVLVTGASSGIGRGVVDNLLARKNAAEYHYVFTVRSNIDERGKSLLSGLDRFNTQHGEGKKLASTAEVDLANLESVRTLAKRMNDEVGAGILPPIRAMILNAGWQDRINPVSFSTDGLEVAFQVNTLANVQFALLLLPSIDPDAGRVVYTSSWAHDSDFWINKSENRDPLVWKDDECKQVALEGHVVNNTKNDTNREAGARRYGASKTFLVMWMNRFQKLLTATPKYAKIAVVGVEPGGVLNTNGLRSNPFMERVIFAAILSKYATLSSWMSKKQGLWRTIPKSAGDLVNAALSTEEPFGEHPWDLYMDGSELGTRAAETLDERKQKLLWKSSLGFVGIKEADVPLNTAPSLTP